MAQGFKETPHVDLIAGVELNYRNIYYNNRLYDLLINLPPGVKWQMEKHWQIAMQGVVPVNGWLAFDGQAGYTGYCSMAKDWECSRMDRINGWLGTRLYLEKYDTEFRLRGGRYIYEDYGVTGRVSISAITTWLPPSTSGLRPESWAYI